VCSNCVLVKKIDCGNPGQSRNYGIADVKSEWIAFWDSDDKPNVKNIVQSVKANRNRDVLVGQFSTSSELNKSYPVDRKTTRILQVAFNPGLWRIVMKREIVLFGFPPIRMGEDQVFLMRNDLFNKNLKICEEEFYTYSIRVKNQLTRNLSAIRELKLAIVYSLRVIARKPTWHLSLYLIMICRLTYTYIASNFRKVN
jgi:glycosyltransferase involved in cell wall biosynthesis